MMNTKGLLAVALCILTNCGWAVAQKYEQESRIKTRQLPLAISSYLDRHYPERSKVRHYEEYSRDDENGVLILFYESKFDLGSHRYSVKFDSSGSLYDIERLVPARRLPNLVRQQIEEDLSVYFQKYRISKIQEILEPNGSVLGYELVVKGKRNQDIGYFELKYNAEARRRSVISIQERLNPFFFF